MRPIRGLEAMNYRLIATTVFTPLEYGMCGLTEEQCKEKPRGFSQFFLAAQVWRCLPVLYQGTQPIIALSSEARR